MKKMTHLMLALGFLVTVSVAGQAHAGWFKKDQKVETNNNIHRFDMFPSMSFFSGTLQRDAYSGWRLDNLNLQLVDNNVVAMDDSGSAFLQEGSTAIVMGVKEGSTLVAYRVRVMKTDYGYGEKDSGIDMRPGPHPGIRIGNGPH